MLTLLACTSSNLSDDSSATGMLDLRMDFLDPPDPGLQFKSPDMQVGPYEEALYCYYGIYEGEDIGITYMTPLSVPGFTHHNQLKAVYDETFEPETLVGCPDPINSGMPVYAPLFEAAGLELEGGEPPPVDENGVINWIDLPEGVAFKLHSGQRWVMDLHYVNTTDQTILVNAAVNLGTLAPEQVTQWAGPLQFDAGELEVLPGQETTVQFTCPFDQDATIYTLMGHMHDHGTSYTIDLEQSGESSRLYDVADWGPTFREYPRISSWRDGSLQVKVGDGLTTTCTWYNDTDSTLAFPYEMCTTVGVIYPLEEPKSCFGDKL